MMMKMIVITMMLHIVIVITMMLHIVFMYLCVSFSLSKVNRGKAKNVVGKYYNEVYLC